MAFASSAVGVQAPQRLVDVDLAPSHLLHELDARGCRRGRLLDAELGEKPVEARSGSRIAHAQVPLEVLHVSARGEEDSKDLSVLVGQDAELARIS